MIKPGEVAYHKLNDEKVFVLRIDSRGKDLEEFKQLSGQVATVRRFSNLEGGTFPQIELYSVEELETREENTTRRIAWEVEITKRVREALGPRGEETPQGKGFLN